MFSLYASVWGGIFGIKYNDNVMLYQEVLYLLHSFLFFQFLNTAFRA